MPRSVPDTDRNRLRSLDGLCGAACAAIILIHVWMFDRGDAGDEPKSVLDYVIGELRLAVPLFFALSGFLVFRPFVAAALEGRRRPSVRRYALKRAARILPAYWFTVLAVFALLAILDHERQISASQLPVFLAFAQNQFEATIGRLDPPMWTLCVEMTFYLLVPVVGIAALRLGTARGRQLALCGGLVALGAAFVAAAAIGDWPRTTTTSLLTNLTSFAAGMGAVALVHGRELRRGTAWALLLGGVALVVADGAWHALAIGPLAWREIVADQPAALGFGMMIAALAGSAVRVPALERRPLTTLGILSYGAYLWHFPVIYALRSWDAWPERLVSASAAVYAMTFAIAWVSWLALEQPVIRWAHRRRPRPAPAGTPRPRTAGAGRGGSPRPAEAAWAAGRGRI